MGSKGFFIITVVVAFVLNCLEPVSATEAHTSSANQSDAAGRVEHVATVLSEIMEAPDQGIPEALLKKAHGIAVIPHVVKGAFGVGGPYGKGLVARRDTDGGWGIPLFIEIGGGSFGLQLGVDATDVVMVFMRSDGIKPLLNSKLKIGADTSVASGPVGRKRRTGTDFVLKSAIYSYSRSKGLFTGIALDGAVIQLDDDANKDVFGKKNAADISNIKIDDAALGVVEPFLRALQKYAPAEAPKLNTTTRR